MSTQEKAISETAIGLPERTRNICSQFTRYGGVYNEELAAILELLTDINDDMQNGRSTHGIREQIQQVKNMLDCLPLE